MLEKSNYIFSILAIILSQKQNTDRISRLNIKKSRHALKLTIFWRLFGREEFILGLATNKS